MKLSNLPDKDYPLASVVDTQPITLNDVVEFLFELAPFVKFAFRIMLIYAWMILIAMLMLQKF
jgi:hypothetical protein